MNAIVSELRNEDSFFVLYRALALCSAIGKLTSERRKAMRAAGFTPEGIADKLLSAKLAITPHNAQLFASVVEMINDAVRVDMIPYRISATRKVARNTLANIRQFDARAKTYPNRMKMSFVINQLRFVLTTIEGRDFSASDVIEVLRNGQYMMLR